MRNSNICIFAFLLLFNLKCHASDSLQCRLQRLVVKYNVASLVFRGIDLQAEYLLSPRQGIWVEGASHRQAFSELNSSVYERNILMGWNCYKLFKNSARPHNGVYAGPYLKYRQGYFSNDRQADYKAVYAGLQSGIQSITKDNLVFCMGMGLGIGQFLYRNELTFHTFYDYYQLPFLDFRATIALGYLF